MTSPQISCDLAADIAGYSALMDPDEEATVRDLTAHQAVILPMIGANVGRIIDTAGDGILAGFGSVVCSRSRTSPNQDAFFASTQHS
jgi:adenylate cyclase